MSLPRETLERALTVLRAVAQPDGDARIITNPWPALERAGLPRDAVSELMQAGCLVGLGRLRFRVSSDHLPSPEDPREDAHAVAPTPSPLRPCVLIATRSLPSAAANLRISSTGRPKRT